MNLKDLKVNMWIEVCEGDDDIKMSKEYKKLISDIGNEEVSGGVYILNFEIGKNVLSKKIIILK